MKSNPRKKKNVAKRNLPDKLCVACGRRFTWRKKWERDWEHVRYCSDRCRQHQAAKSSLTEPREDT